MVASLYKKGVDAIIFDCSSIFWVVSASWVDNKHGFSVTCTIDTGKYTFRRTRCHVQDPNAECAHTTERSQMSTDLPCALLIRAAFALMCLFLALVLQYFLIKLTVFDLVADASAALLELVCKLVYPVCKTQCKSVQQHRG